MSINSEVAQLLNQALKECISVVQEVEDEAFVVSSRTFQRVPVPRCAEIRMKLAILDFYFNVSYSKIISRSLSACGE